VRRVFSDRRKDVGCAQHACRVNNDRRHAKEVCRVSSDRRQGVDRAEHVRRVDSDRRHAK
jgi:hypothetical protein